MAKQVAEIFTEVLVAPAYEDGAVEILQGKKNIRLLVAPACRRPSRWRCARSAAACCCSTRDRFQAPGDDPSAWTLAAGDAGLSRGPGRPGLRVEGLPRGQVQRDPAGLRRRLGRRRHGPGQPRRLLPPGRLPRRRPRHRLRRRLRRLLPVPRRPRGAHRGRRQGSRPARRLHPRRSSHRSRHRRPASPCTSPAPATSSTNARASQGLFGRRRGGGRRRFRGRFRRSRGGGSR